MARSTVVPPAAAALFTFKPVAAEAVEASIFRVGLVAPAGPAARIFALALDRISDVPVPFPIAVFDTPRIAHAMISTMSLSAAAVPSTTLVPLVAVYSLVVSFTPLRNTST